MPFGPLFTNQFFRLNYADKLTPAGHRPNKKGAE